MTDNTAIATTNANDTINVNDGYICTVNRDTAEGKLTVANALADADPLSGIGDEHFTLKDVITLPGLRSNTGEQCVNVYLVTDDGRILMSQSTGIARSASQITALFDGDFGDGVETSVVSKKLRNGNTMKSLHFYC